MTIKAIATLFVLLVFVSCSFAAEVKYFMIQGPDDPDSRFEPSGAAYDSETGRVIVFNDKSDEPPVHVYEPDPETVLSLVSAYEPTGADGESVSVKKFEDAAASDYKSGEFYAVTSWDRPDEAYRKLLRFSIRDGVPVLVDDESLALDVESLIKKTGHNYVKIEGLSVMPSDGSLVVGIREVGPDFEHPTRLVSLWKLTPGSAGHPAKLLMEFDTIEIIGREEGVSGIEYDPVGGRYLMTTSYEGAGYTTQDVGGHLWVIDAAALEGCIEVEPEYAVEAVAEFSHKPEALYIDKEGVVVVLFDDDDDRKEPDPEKAAKLGRFCMRQNQAFAATVTID
jgi:hypothetical protein